ncbi:hypothetical protein AK812_SmicGene39569 [Symbiodinium microadriaticum]|uniref:PPM-type phosphatase domain-containing protein n=1 Tax=Symbiodinium microadriaticum TaxID=2951 RepID=A0A1Q9CAY9_SYMMI|nr:hypothetical protein AK812_SmicGene39569 [Symbiodinium microadriaticum]
MDAVAAVRTLWLDRSHLALALYCDGIAEQIPAEELAVLLRRSCGSERRAAAELTCFKEQNPPSRLCWSAFSDKAGTRRAGQCLAHAQSLADSFPTEFVASLVPIFEVPVLKGSPCQLEGFCRAS